jgi:hypothetical protein
VVAVVAALVVLAGPAVVEAPPALFELSSPPHAAATSASAMVPATTADVRTRLMDPPVWWSRPRGTGAS